MADDEIFEQFDQEIEKPGDKKHARGQVYRPDATGDFEQLAVASMGDLARPLNLSAKMLKQGGGPFVKYQEGYNMYATPLRATVRSMGRMKDVLRTGAPNTPADLLRNPKLAKKFKHLALDAKADQGAESAMGSFADSVTRMKVSAAGLNAGQAQLQAATENYRAVQLRLQRHAKEAKLAGMVGQIAAIDHAAEVCARVVEVSAEAVTGAAEIDMAMEVGADVEEPMDTEAGGAIEDSATEQWSSGQQKVGSGIASAGKGLGAAKGIAAAVQKYALAGQSFQLKDVFIVMSGDAGKYLQLQKDIQSLSEAINNLELLEEKQMIHEAGTRLDGFQLELAVRKDTMTSDRGNARNRAQELATAWGGGKDAMYAMYSAEAYQELDLYGTHADSSRREHVDPHLRRVGHMLSGDDHGDMIRGEFPEDASELDRNVHQTALAKDYFERNLPEWQRNAEAWRAFLEERSGKRVLHDNGE